MKPSAFPSRSPLWRVARVIVGLLIFVGVTGWTVLSHMIRQENKANNERVKQAKLGTFPAEPLPELRPIELGLVDAALPLQTIAGIRIWLPGRAVKSPQEVPSEIASKVSELEVYSGEKNDINFRVSHGRFFEDIEDPERALKEEIALQVSTMKANPEFSDLSLKVADYEFVGARGKVAEITIRHHSGNIRMLTLSLVRGRDLWQILVAGEAEKMDETSVRVFKSVQMVD